MSFMIVSSILAQRICKLSPSLKRLGNGANALALHGPLLQAYIIRLVKFQPSSFPPFELQLSLPSWLRSSVVFSLISESVLRNTTLVNFIFGACDEGPLVCLHIVLVLHLIIVTCALQYHQVINTNTFFIITVGWSAVLKKKNVLDRYVLHR